MRRLFTVLLVPAVAIGLSLSVPTANAQEKDKKEEKKKKGGKKKKDDKKDEKKS